MYRWCPDCHKRIDLWPQAFYCRKCGGRTYLKFDAGNVLITPGGHQFKIIEDLSQCSRTGISTVYLAEQLDLKERVVLKVGCGEDKLSFLEQEFYLLTELRHKHIIKLASTELLSTFIEGEPIWFMVLEYMPERSLEYRLRQRRRLSIEQATILISQICEAVSYIHQQGYIHFDIKLSNILLKAKNQAVLSDFDVTQHQSAVKTPQGHQVGLTLPYAAPELLEEVASLDHRVDIYALGMSLYEILVNRYPLYRSFDDLADDDNDNAVEAKLEARIKAGNIPRPHELMPQAHIPSPYENLIFKAIAKDREVRYSTVEQFQSDLKELSVQRTTEQLPLVHSVVRKLLSSFS